MASRVKESVYEHVGVHVDGARERMRDGELAEKLHGTFNWQQRRLLDAYPEMKPEHGRSVIGEIRAQLAKYGRKHNA